MTTDDWVELIVAEPDDYPTNVAVFADWLEEREQPSHLRLRAWLEMDLRLRALKAVPTAGGPRFGVMAADNFVRTFSLVFVHEDAERFLLSTLLVMPAHRTSRPRADIAALLHDRLSRPHLGGVRLDALLLRRILRRNLHDGAELSLDAADPLRAASAVVAAEQDRERRREAVGGITTAASSSLTYEHAFRMLAIAHATGRINGRLNQMRLLVARANGYGNDPNCRCSLAATRWLLAGAEVCRDLLRRDP